MDLKNLFRHGDAKDGGRECKIKQTRLQEPIEGTPGKRASACTDLQQLPAALQEKIGVDVKINTKIWGRNVNLLFEIE